MRGNPPRRRLEATQPSAKHFFISQDIGEALLECGGAEFISMNTFALKGYQNEGVEIDE